MSQSAPVAVIAASMRVSWASSRGRSAWPYAGRGIIAAAISSALRAWRETLGRIDHAEYIDVFVAPSMKRGLRCSVRGVTAAMVLFTASAAHGDGAGFAVDGFQPAERGSDWFANESLDLRGHLRPAVGATYAWGYRSYVLRDESGAEQRQVLTDQMWLHVGGAMVLAHRLRLGLDVPMVVFQHGDDLASLAEPRPDPSTPAFGDVRLAMNVRLFGEFGGLATAGIGAQAYFPTGSREQLTSDGTLRILPRASLAGHVLGIVYSLTGGFHYRPLDEVVLGRAMGSELVFAAATGVKVNDVFVLGPELAGRTAVTGRTPSPPGAPR